MSLSFISYSAYFDTEGRRKGYDIDDVDVLIQAKYREAQLLEPTGAGGEEDRGSAKEKKIIITAIEAFQETERENDQHRKIYKKRRKSAGLDLGKSVMKWKNIRK